MDRSQSDFDTLLGQLANCKICKASLPYPPRPIFQLNQKAQILIAGQAPGRKVQQSGVPFDDASGDRLRDWMGIDRKLFYDDSQIAILPMGMCYPGSGKSGDLPPRPECVAHWHQQILQHMGNIQLTLLVGKFAMDYHLQQSKLTLTPRVKDWRQYWPAKIALPHPSPRNNIWLKRNPWFEQDVIPIVKKRIHEIL